MISLLLLLLIMYSLFCFWRRQQKLLEKIDTKEIIEIIKNNKKIIFGIIGFGLLLPWVTMIIVGLILNPKELTDMGPKYFFDFDTIKTSLFGFIPFGILALMTIVCFNKSTKQLIPSWTLHKAGVIGVWIETIGLSLFLILMHWISDFSGEYGGGFAAGFTFIVGPIFIVILMPLFYSFGWTAGKLMITIKEYKNKLKQ
ncbi:MAG: hypothetical protein WAX79_02325 [Candidatus Omnitrophota bacterium]